MVREVIYEREVPVGALETLIADVTASNLQALGKALFREASEVMDTAKTVTVPIETGTLAASGIVGTPEVTESSVVVTMGFGGAARAYSVFVHEDPDARHGAAIGKPAGQTWKYLEKPAFEAAVGLPERLAAAVEEDLRAP